MHLATAVQPRTGVCAPAACPQQQEQHQQHSRRRCTCHCMVCLPKAAAAALNLEAWQIEQTSQNAHTFVEETCVALCSRAGRACCCAPTHNQETPQVITHDPAACARGVVWSPTTPRSHTAVLAGLSCTHSVLFPPNMLGLLVRAPPPQVPHASSSRGHRVTPAVNLPCS